MPADRLEAKLQGFEDEFSHLYVPSDPANFDIDIGGNYYLRAWHWCHSFNDEEIAALHLMLKRSDVAGDRLLTYLMVIILNLLEKGLEKGTTTLADLFTWLVHGFSNRYALGVIASRLNELGAFSALCKRAGVIAPRSSVSGDKFETLSSCLVSYLGSGAADLSAIVNAMQLFRGTDRRRYRCVLRRAIRMRPNAYRNAYMFQLGHSLYLDSMVARVTKRMSSHRRKALAAYAWVKKSVDLEEDPPVRFFRLITMAKVCFEGGRLGEAVAYSHELLERQACLGCGDGAAVHAAETTLGLVALATGDVALAKRQLQKSLVSPWSPSLSAFGPSLRLAEELHRVGETQFVISFVQKCIVQYPSKRHELADLVRALETGSEPQWGPFNFY